MAAWAERSNQDKGLDVSMGAEALPGGPTRLCHIRLGHQVRLHPVYFTRRCEAEFPDKAL